MMKLVREHIIFEKFTEDSDPIKDMGIGMIQQIKKWVEENEGPFYTKDDFLWLSVRSRKIEFVKFLLDAGFDVHSKHEEAIKSACEVGDTEIVKLLIDAGANVNADDNAPLRRACRNEENEMIKYLLNTGKFKIEDILDLKKMYERAHPNSAHILNDYILKQKRIKESLYEKFTEDSDPVHDMGIGLPRIWKNLKKGDILRFKRSLQMTGSDDAELYPKDSYIVIKDARGKGFEDLISNCYFIYSYYKNKKDLLKNINANKRDYDGWHFDFDFFKEYFELVSIEELKENVNEKFTEDSDPVHDMGVGIKPLIEKWLKKYGIKHYKINSNFSIDVPYNSVDLEGRHLKNLPSYIQFNYIKGYFTVINNQLTSLRGCPKEVNGFFSCENNKLKSLEYAPKKISGTFNCSYNLISKIDELPDGIKIRVEVNNNAVRFTKKQITKLLNNTDTGDSIKTIVIRL